MKKIIFSLAMIAAVGAIAVGATMSYFSDTETSTGNTFTAGAIDLTVDNTCYYNGIACIGYDSDPIVYYWDNDKTGVIESEEIDDNNICVCTWDKKDLEEGNLFFDFDDIKPGDHGEDTISLHVTSNNAWSCAKIELTANDDVTCVDPELEEEGSGECTDSATTGSTNCATDQSDCFDGELAQNLEFVWWADDGDNVLEVGELVVIHNGDPTPAIVNTSVTGVPLSTIVGGATANWTRDLTTADNEFNMFNSDDYKGVPLEPDTNYYIAKAWCFGDLTVTPLAVGDHNPTTAGNIDCNGKDVTNESQTDQVKGNLSFSAIQSRNNPGFKCPEHGGDPIE